MYRPWVILSTGGGGGVSVPACTTGHMTGGGLRPGRGGGSVPSVRETPHVR